MIITKHQTYVVATLVAIAVIVKFIVQYLVTGFVAFCIIYTLNDLYKYRKKFKFLITFAKYVFPTQPRKSTKKRNATPIGTR